MDYLDLEQYNRPKVCKCCGGIMIFKGVGEYQCEDCRAVDYDDYGKVRLYIEEHKGATAAQIEDGTGVKQRTIRQMLREERLEVAPDSKCFLHCEICGKDIRSGKFCPQCEANYHHKLEEREREKKKKKQMGGFGLGDKNFDTGEKRFKRDR